MKKVYLAKSNMVNHTSYITIKGLLERYDCEVVEWKPGPTAKEDLLECDILLVLTADAIPPFKTEEIKGYFVGRGIHGQIEDFDRFHNSFGYTKQILVANQVMCTQPLQTSIIVDKFKQLRINDEKDWKVRYGKVTVTNNNVPLQEFIPLKS